MTTEQPAPTATSAVGAAPSIHVVRARKLLLGGLIGGVAAAIVCLIVFGLTAGVAGLQSALLAAGMVIFFYAVGQFVMVLFADAGARLLMLVSLSSYLFRVIVLGLLLLGYSNNRESLPALVPTAVFVTAIAVVAGWLVVELFVFSRLRIGVYDGEYVAPSTETSDAGDHPSESIDEASERVDKPVDRS